MPRKKEVVSLQQRALVSLGDFIESRIGIGIYMGASWVAEYDAQGGTTNICHLDSEIERLQNYIFTNLPVTMFSSVVEEILLRMTKLSKLIKNTYKTEVFLTNLMREEGLLIQYTKLVLNDQITKLDLNSAPHVIKEYITDNLQLAPQLRKLNCANSQVKNIDNLQYLTNLVSIKINNVCTDQILNILSINCPKLLSIECFNSCKVTNKGCSFLSNCASLENLDLHKCSVNCNGYLELVKCLPNLVNLGQCDNLGEVLTLLSLQTESTLLDNILDAGNNTNEDGNSTHEDIKIYKPAPKVLKLKIINCSQLMSEQLKLIIEMCLSVEELILYRVQRFSTLTLSKLSQLSKLRTLKLSGSGDFFSFRDGCKFILETVGSKLRDLFIERVNSIDMQALQHISQECPNLEKLTFYRCAFTNQRQTPQVFVRRSPFTKLKEFTCVGTCVEEHIQYVISLSSNLTYVHIDNPIVLSDQSFTNLLTNDALKFLQVLHIPHSLFLTMNTVYKVLASCKHLRILTEPDKWKNINSDELNAFRTYLVDDNIDLDINPVTHEIAINKPTRMEDFESYRLQRIIHQHYAHEGGEHPHFLIPPGLVPPFEVPPPEDPNDDIW